MDADAFAAVAMPIAGVSGIVLDVGVTGELAADGSLVPMAFVAVMVKTYGVPLVNPLTVNGLDVPVPIIPLGFDVAVNEVIGEPPALFWMK